MTSERSIFFILLGVLVIVGIGGPPLSRLLNNSKKEDSRPSPRLGNACGSATRSLNHIRQCAFPKKGRHLRTDIGNELEKRGLIRLCGKPRVPMRGLHVLLSSRGEARGFWLFEGSFPVASLTHSGYEIAPGIATPEATPTTRRGAKWMTEEFVPFSAEVQLDAKGAKSGFAGLKKIIHRDRRRSMMTRFVYQLHPE